MPRYKITVEYSGTPYCGFQRQAQGPSVQGALEAAIFRLTNHEVTLMAAGRTDAGVHALGQVCHADLPKAYGAGTVQSALNFYLGDEAISVIHAEAVSDNFHARFSARKRHYLYRILNRPAPSPLRKNAAWHVPKPLNLQAMQEAATYLIGHHDFQTFRMKHCQALSSTKTLDALTLHREADELQIGTSALSFLHHQVRNMVGSLYWVGCGRWYPEDLKKALVARDRAQGGPTAPAHGLYLTKVDYDI